MQLWYKETTMSESKPFNGVTGYRTLSDNEKALMNKAKQLEAECAELFKTLAQDLDVHRDNSFELQQARTNLQTGFMWLSRAVALPVDPFNKE